MNKKRLIVFSIIIGVIIIVITVIIFKWFAFLGCSVLMPSQSSIENLLEKNNKELQYIAEFMYNMDDEYIRWGDSEFNQLDYITEDDKGSITYVTETIEDYRFSNYIKLLQQEGIIHIIKKSNYISFCTWGSFSSDCGLIYCIENPSVINSYGKTNIYKIEDHWYYYTYVE